MDGEATTELPTALRGYDRAAVEVFFERAAARRARLEAVIAEASARRERAVAAQVRNRAIAADAQREIDEIRATAEARATEIVVAARLEAQVVLRGAREQSGVRADDLTLIDLREPDPDRFDAAGGSDYFEYLRGALPVEINGAE